MGFPALMTGIIVSVVGGIGSPLGALAGSVLVAFCEQIAAVWLAAPWPNAVAFVIFVSVLLWNPSGILRLSKSRSNWRGIGAGTGAVA
jgi:branched-subunit amino acid ABC-type transport system permease component